MEDSEENPKLMSSIYGSATAAIPTLDSNSVLQNTHTKVSSFAENLSQADTKGTTYILMESVPLLTCLFWKQDLDASGS